MRSTGFKGAKWNEKKVKHQNKIRKGWGTFNCNISNSGVFCETNGKLNKEEICEIERLVLKFNSFSLNAHAYRRILSEDN